MLAIEHERPYALELLIKAGANLKLQESKGGNTPLHIAAKKGFVSAAISIMEVCPEAAVM